MYTYFIGICSIIFKTNLISFMNIWRLYLYCNCKPRCNLASGPWFCVWLINTIQIKQDNVQFVTLKNMIAFVYPGWGDVIELQSVQQWLPYLCPFIYITLNRFIFWWNHDCFSGWGAGIELQSVGWWSRNYDCMHYLRPFIFIHSIDLYFGETMIDFPAEGLW